METPKEMPKPTSQHQKLEMLVGRWRGTETMHPSPWDPEGGTATGRNDIRLTLNGFALITEYEQERGGVITFQGHGVMTYDLTREGILRSRMDLSEDGVDWATFFECDYERE